MKPTLPLAFAVLSLTAGVLAAPAPSDVPAHHWARGSVQSLTTKKIMTADPDGKFRGDKPVTRYELAVTLDRFIQYMEKSRQPLHPTSVGGLVTVPRTANARQRLAFYHLVSQGFLPANSPLLAPRGDGPVSARELADALAQVITRLSDRSLPPPQE